MHQGATYLGVVLNAAHGSWLHNVLDRAALLCMIKEGQPLHEQDLATCIKEHFSEVLDSLHEMDAEKDVEFESND